MEDDFRLDQRPAQPQLNAVVLPDPGRTSKPEEQLL
jgi:hypothetical protein